MSEEQFNKISCAVVIKDITEFIRSYASFYVIDFSRYSYANALLWHEIQISVYLKELCHGI